MTNRPQGDTGVHQHVIEKSDGDETLILADSADWLGDRTVQIVCERGFVDLGDWR